MANKKTENKNTQNTQRRNTTSRVRIVDLLAFLALAASAVLLLVGPIVRWALDNAVGQTVLTVLNFIAQYCLLAAIAIPGWYFVRGRGKTWKGVYVVLRVIYIAGTIIGISLGV